MRLKNFLTEAQQRYTVQGVNDEYDKCTVCGKENLKKCVWLSPIGPEGEEGDAFPVGVDCASKMMIGSKTTKGAKEIWSIAQAIDKAQEGLKKKADPKQIERVLQTKYKARASTTKRDDVILLEYMPPGGNRMRYKLIFKDKVEDYGSYRDIPKECRY